MKLIPIGLVVGIAEKGFSRSLSGIDLLFLRFRNATMWIGISLGAGDRSKQVVAIQERRDIELLRRLEGEKGLLAAFLGDFWCPPVAEQL